MGELRKCKENYIDKAFQSILCAFLSSFKEIARQKKHFNQSTTESSTSSPMPSNFSSAYNLSTPIFLSSLPSKNHECYSTWLADANWIRNNGASKAHRIIAVRFRWFGLCTAICLQAIGSGCACRARQLVIRCNNKAIERFACQNASLQQVANRVSFNLISAGEKKKLSKGVFMAERVS